MSQIAIASISCVIYLRFIYIKQPLQQRRGARPVRPISFVQQENTN